MIAAIAPFLWLHPAVRELGERFLGLPGLLLGLATLPAAFSFRARRGAPAEAAALTLIAFALSFAVDVEPWALGIALTGFFGLVLGRLRDELWLREVGAGAQLCAALTLLTIAVFPRQFDSCVVPGAGAPMIAFGTVGAGLVISALLTRHTHGRASALGVAAALVGFAWLCLGVADAFDDGPQIVFLAGRHEARDMTLSIAWALYSLALLGLGTRLRRQGLRWVSLGFTLLTVGKVFLVDLGELDGLYRVASMTGLALSLLLVSLLYQRVIFRKPAVEGA